MSTILFFLPFLLIFTVLAVYAERKISAFIQDRYGPMEVGYYGILQSVADLVKLVQKEDIVPANASPKLFKLAPLLIFMAVFGGFAVVPITSVWSGSEIETGLFYLLAIVSLDVLGVIMAGWASNNKYALLGAIRSASQVISYEVPLTLSVLCIVIISQSLSLQEISYQQGVFISDINPDYKNYLFGLSFLNIDVTDVGGVLTWNVFRMPLSFIAWLIFLTASLAESNRAPFDLPEAESELVAGFHTEYSGFRWSVIMLAEYGMMLLTAFLGAILFFGSWYSPLPNIGELRLAEWTTGKPGLWYSFIINSFWLVSKVLIIILIHMWARWTFPRVRMDQLMNLGWKYLTPASLVMLILSAIWKLFMI